MKPKYNSIVKLHSTVRHCSEIMSGYKKRTSGFSTKVVHVPYEHERSRMAVVAPITTSAIFRQDEPETVEV